MSNPFAFREMIGETSLISEAIARNEIPSLRRALAGLFNFRGELLMVKEPTSEDFTELQFTEELIGRVLVYLADWWGIDKVAGELLLTGVIKSRGEAMRLAAPIYDRLDADSDEEKEERESVIMVGVVGRIASGKGTIGEILHKNLGAMALPLSDRLREFATAKGSVAPFPREDLRRINDELKPRFGNPVFVRWTLDMAQRLISIYEPSVMVIDGFRSVEEAQLFKDRGGILIFITASDEVRYQRLLERNRGADDFNREAFNKSDAKEKEWIEPIKEIADVVIGNDGNLDQLEEQLMRALEVWSASPPSMN